MCMSCSICVTVLSQSPDKAKPHTPNRKSSSLVNCPHFRPLKNLVWNQSSKPCWFCCGEFITVEQVLWTIRQFDNESVDFSTDTKYWNRSSQKTDRATIDEVLALFADLLREVPPLSLQSLDSQEINSLIEPILRFIRSLICMEQNVSVDPAQEAKAIK